MRSLKKAKIKPGQVVLLRTDFDVPLEKGNIIDDFRLKAALPTIKFLLEKKVKVIIISHLGRPRGKVVKNLSLAPVANWLGEKLQIPAGQVMVLRNLRFSPNEEKNNLKFAQSLAAMADIYVNDAFAVSHRKHASIVGIPQFLPSFAGLQLEKEARGLKKALSFKKDLVVILGGAKTRTKIPVIENLIKSGAIVLLGGAIANTFLAAFLGRERMDGAIIQEKEASLAKRFLQDLDKPVSFAQIPGQTTKIWLPLDLWVATEKTPLKLINFTEPYLDSVPKDHQIYGLGPKTLKEYAGLISQAKAIIWNGPVSRHHPIKTPTSTIDLGQTIAESKAFSIVGGGDTVATLAKAGILAKMDLVSTGGGAMLAYLAHGTLPGFEVLKK
jgi:3-phosphoglycerate kinase